jgi:hypothetical protein
MMVGGAAVKSADIMAANGGVIHVIGEVLQPVSSLWVLANREPRMAGVTKPLGKSGGRQGLEGCAWAVGCSG